MSKFTRRLFKPNEVLAISISIHDDWKMKLAILIGVIGIFVGYLAGRNHRGFDEQKNSSERVETIAKSTRNLARSGKMDRSSDRQGGSLRVAQIHEQALKKLKHGRQISALERGRLTSWIMSLQADDFPQILKTLREIDRHTENPFHLRGSQTDFQVLALGRWYELEGEPVLDWISTSPELPSRRIPEILAAIIADQFPREPSGSLQIVKKYADSLSTSTVPPELVGDWFYQVARWSQNLEEDFAQLDLLAQKYTFGASSADPFSDSPYGDNSSELLDGLVHSGRGNQSKDLIAKKYPDMIDELNRKIDKHKLGNLADKGWRAIKSGVDSGEIQPELSNVLTALTLSTEKDHNEAIDWVLSQQFDGSDKSTVIATIIEQEFYRDVSSGNTAGIKFLEERAAQGDPVDQGWAFLIERAIDQERWNEVETISKKIPAALWQQHLESLKRQALTNYQTSLLGISFNYCELKPFSSEALERFGLLEEVKATMKEQNRTAAQKLKKILEAE